MREILISKILFFSGTAKENVTRDYERRLAAGMKDGEVFSTILDNSVFASLRFTCSLVHLG